MHFRVRKNVIQLIRTNYDDRKKKGVNTIIGNVKLAKPELSPDLLQNLTAEEIAAFEIWAKTQLRAEVLREEVAALTLAETMDLAGKWFEREGNSEAAQATASHITFHWQTMRKIFIKNGLLN